MNYTLSKIDGKKVAKIFALSTAIIYILPLLALLVPQLLLLKSMPSMWEFMKIQIIIYIASPLIYFIVSYVSMRIFCGVFNKFGGVGFQFEGLNPVQKPVPAPQAAAPAPMPEPKIEIPGIPK